jgi:hypothetical protein
MGITDDIRDMQDNFAGDTSLQDRYEELKDQEANGTITEDGRIELQRIREKLNM